MNDRLHHVFSEQASAADLLLHYQAGATFFASPRRSLLAHGVQAVLPPCAPGRIAAHAAAFLKDAAGGRATPAVLMGALPFCLDSSSAAPYLYLPRQLASGAGVDHAAAGPGLALGNPGARLPGAPLMQPTPQQYRANVRRALADIGAARFEKTVLSRSLTLDASIDLPVLLQRLAARNLRGYTFAINLAGAAIGQAGAPRTLIGASPELLLSRHGRALVSHPLAGSIPRSADPAEDRRRADGLLQSAKDLHEHALVVEAVAAAMRPYCKTLHVPAAPSLLSTATMWHLGTQVRGELADPATTSLEVALALHPTPAVCGHPAAPAASFIAEAEGFDRRYFAGLVGWCDSHGDGEWAVTLRCAEVGAAGATLYAGAGIVAGSEPQLELLETSAKLRTMLAAMNLELQLEDEPTGEQLYEHAKAVS
ncbi:isochorismate synthase [Janthinobacterium agaricidamnosum]|uniref:isochorismate synthase n=1 Tax=Janthinobacterium agaricidamnosum NBRC 102515 = DSM 9628 TaxID=1349767 RepID=W0V7X3_9BURK|nr:isochorismate synthase [Janthinobacterium agaricidamnosum]CDG83720.1 isochorismate synthase dhbC [Janthinobacterium agaricidamnosum NBRC 102515 = DSM 9628]